MSFKVASKSKDTLSEDVELGNKLLSSTSAEHEMPILRDVGGGGGGHAKPEPPSPGNPGNGGGGKVTPAYIYRTDIRVSYYKWTKSVAVHTGVPTWKEPLGQNPTDEEKQEQNVVEVDGIYYRIHFGELDCNCRPGDPLVSSGYNWYFLPDDVDAAQVFTSEGNPWTNPFTKKFTFFSNDLSMTGLETYAWPFYYNTTSQFDSIDLQENDGNWIQMKKSSFRGVLTNMWAGCEPTCAILSKLIKDGFYCSYPWNKGLGYMFRKSVPKLVFVFANEYDNSFRASYDYYSGFSFFTPLVVPGIDGSNVTFYQINLGAVREAPDPYCVKQLQTSDSTGSNIINAFDKYMDQIGLGSSSLNTQL